LDFLRQKLTKQNVEAKQMYQKAFASKEEIDTSIPSDILEKKTFCEKIKGFIRQFWAIFDNKSNKTL
jgi:hypothetical protein